MSGSSFVILYSEPRSDGQRSNGFGLASGGDRDMFVSGVLSDDHDPKSSGVLAYVVTKDGAGTLNYVISQGERIESRHSHVQGNRSQNSVHAVIPRLALDERTRRVTFKFELTEGTEGTVRFHDLVLWFEEK